MKFRKKPVVIEAIQLTPQTIRHVYEFIHGPLPMGRWGREKWDDYCAIVSDEGMTIATLEDGRDGRAKHVATMGDWIIKGIQGEFYPCKPDIFNATYEAAE